MKKLYLLLIPLFLSGCSKAADVPSEIPDIPAVTEAATKTSPAATTASTSTTTAATTQTEYYNAVLKTTPSETVTEPTAPQRIPENGELVRILDYIPDAVIDLRYATSNNFTGVVLYDDPEAYICYGTVKKLMEVQEELKENGFRILIWDAYRAPEAQQRLWEAYPDPNFVADPRNGLTSHSRGGTVDIALALENGDTAELPSGFDEFNSKADRDFSDVSPEAAANATLLQETMYRHGFKGYIGEWWDYTDLDGYTLIIPEG